MSVCVAAAALVVMIVVVSVASVLVVFSLRLPPAPARGEAFSSGSDSGGRPNTDCQRPLVIVSLTTSPARISSIEPTLQSLYQNQTVRPDRIELNLPNVFRRDNSTFTASDVARFAGLPYVAVHRINDVGPISKFAPTLSRYASKPKTIIIVVDDDTLYPPDLVERLVAGATQHPEAIVTAHCTNHYTLNDTPCDLVEGFKSYLLRPAHFRPSFWAFLAAALESDECYRADDFVLSAYIHTAKVPLLRLDAPAPLKTPQLSYGFEGDALHRQQPLEDPQTRYCGCFLHLQEKLPVSLGLRARCAQTQFEH